MDVFAGTRPELGDWYCFPQNVERVGQHAPSTKEHRLIVASNVPHGLEHSVVLRTTKSGYGRTRHSRTEIAAVRPDAASTRLAGSAMSELPT